MLNVHQEQAVLLSLQHRLHTLLKHKPGMLYACMLCRLLYPLIFLQSVAARPCQAVPHVQPRARARVRVRPRLLKPLPWVEP